MRRMTDVPDGLAAVSAAVDRVAAAEAGRPDARRGVLDRWLGSVLATVLGGLALAALGGIAGVLTLGAGAVLLGLVAGAGAVAGLVRLAARDADRDTVARATQRDARVDLVETVSGVLAHVERLDAERALLHGKVEKLERRLSAKQRKLARLQAFDAERRTLEPPPDQPLDGQLTFDAVAGSSS